MSELKLCSYCKSVPQANTWTLHGISETRYFCPNPECPHSVRTVTLEQWNTRPIEDALNKRIAELEAAQRWIPVSERLPDAYEKVIALAKDCMNVDWVLPKELREVGKGAFARLYNVTHWMSLPTQREVQE